MEASDSSFGRMFITLDWNACTPMSDESDSFSVPVHLVGMSPKHAHPVIYLATSDSAQFIIIIPCGSKPPREEAASTTTTQIIRDIELRDPPPFNTVILPNITARQEVHTAQIIDSKALRMEDG